MLWQNEPDGPVFRFVRIQGLENHSVLRCLFETDRRQGKKPHEFFLTLLAKTTTQAQVALYRKSLPPQTTSPHASERKKPPLTTS